MVSQPGFFCLVDRYAALSKAGDPLERLKEVVSFEAFRYRLEKALSGSDRVVATDILDRLLHHSTVITIRRDSFRLREKHRSSLLQKAGSMLGATENTGQ